MKKNSQKACSQRGQQSTLFQSWGYADQKVGSSAKGHGGNHDPFCNNTRKQTDTLASASNVTGSLLSVSKEAQVVIDDSISDNGFEDDFDLADCVENFEVQSRLDKAFTGSVSPEKIPGFDDTFGTSYVYPTNYPVREYQFNIIKKGLLCNTLAVLPTGLGKTFLAAVVMYNFYRWYPLGKIIFMAPTKPLVAQQIEACYDIMGIPQADTAEMTGSTSAAKRVDLWKRKRVFFLTPQVLQNDLARGTCCAADIVCLIFDEAHKALGNHAYCQVVKEVRGYTSHFRILALSATPGEDMKAVQQVVNNLLISHVEIRSEESADIAPYLHSRDIEKVVVPFSDNLKATKATFLEVLSAIVRRLYCNRALWQEDPERVSKFLLLKARDQYRSNNAALDRSKVGAVEGDFALAISLYHAYELIQQHGLLSFYTFLKGILSGAKGTPRTKTELSRNQTFMQMMERLHHEIEPEDGDQSLNESICAASMLTPKQRLLKSIPKGSDTFASHPKFKKLEEIVLGHFRSYQKQAAGGKTCTETPASTRVMIFSQYRDSVQEITRVLTKHEPLVKAMSFVGQSSKEGAGGIKNKGLSQKEQYEVIQRFRCGGYNVLVSTSVGEEGLDIGEVDLIICFDASSSPIRLVQRMGRTGRKRAGKIIVLVSEGKEEQVYHRSVSNKKGIHKSLLNAANSLVLYGESPRMIPKHLNPVCHKMQITVEKFVPCRRGRKRKSSPAANVNAKDAPSLTGGYLSSADEDYLRVHYYGRKDACPRCKELQNDSQIAYCHHLPLRKLSLSEWSQWQRTPQPSSSIAHSTLTYNFCRVMEFIEMNREELEVAQYERDLKQCLRKGDIILPPLTKSISSRMKHISSARQSKRRVTIEISEEESDFESEKVEHEAVCTISPLASVAVVEHDNKFANLPSAAECRLNESPARLKDNLEIGNPILRKLPGVKNKMKKVLISDQQIGLCSQSMDTLFERCQKRRACGSLSPLGGDKAIRLEADVEASDLSNVSPPDLPSASRISVPMVTDIKTEKNLDGEGQNADVQAVDSACLFSTQSVNNFFKSGSPIKIDMPSDCLSSFRSAETVISAIPEPPSGVELGSFVLFDTTLALDAAHEPHLLNSVVHEKTPAQEGSLPKTPLVDIPDFDKDSFSEKEPFEACESTKDRNSCSTDEVCRSATTNSFRSLEVNIPGAPEYPCSYSWTRDVPTPGRVRDVESALEDDGIKVDWDLVDLNDSILLVTADDRCSSPAIVTQFKGCSVDQEQPKSTSSLGDGDGRLREGDANLESQTAGSPLSPSQDGCSVSDVVKHPDLSFDSSPLFRRPATLSRRRAIIDTTVDESASQPGFKAPPSFVIPRHAVREDVAKTVEKEDKLSPLFRRPATSRARKRHIQVDSPDDDSAAAAAADDDDDDDDDDDHDDDFETDAIGKFRACQQRGSLPSKKRPKRRLQSSYIEMEAVDEGDCEDASDDLDGTELNRYVLDSFIDDASQPSPEVVRRRGKAKESPVDMMAVYKQSLLSPAQTRLKFASPQFHAHRNRYKLANIAEKRLSSLGDDDCAEAEEVNGLIESDEISSSDNASDCHEETAELQSEYDAGEVSVLGTMHPAGTAVLSPVGENDLSTTTSLVKKTIGRSSKRLKYIEDFSEDEEDLAPNGFANDVVKKDLKSDSVKQGMIATYWCRVYSADEIPTPSFSFGIEWNDSLESQENALDVHTEALGGKQGVPTILMDSKAVANSQIANMLRLKQKVDVIVLQQLGCDYVVSQRMAVDKKSLSDVSNGAHSGRTAEHVRALASQYSKPCFIIEKDRLKGSSIDRPCLLTKYYASVLARLALSGVSVLYSDGPEETAAILGKLCRREAENGFAISCPKESKNEQLSFLKQLLEVSQVTYPIAMEIMCKYRSLRALVSSPLADLQKNLPFLSASRVQEIYSFFRRKFNFGMINTKR